MPKNLLLLITYIQTFYLLLFFHLLSQLFNYDISYLNILY